MLDHVLVIVLVISYLIGINSCKLILSVVYLICELFLLFLAKLLVLLLIATCKLVI